MVDGHVDGGMIEILLGRRESAHEPLFRRIPGESLPVSAEDVVPDFGRLSRDEIDVRRVLGKRRRRPATIRRRTNGQIPVRRFVDVQRPPEAFRRLDAEGVDRAERVLRQELTRIALIVEPEAVAAFAAARELGSRRIRNGGDVGDEASVFALREEQLPFPTARGVRRDARRRERRVLGRFVFHLRERHSSRHRAFLRGPANRLALWIAVRIVRTSRRSTRSIESTSGIRSRKRRTRRRRTSSCAAKAHGYTTSTAAASSTSSRAGG